MLAQDILAQDMLAQAILAQAILAQAMLAQAILAQAILAQAILVQANVAHVIKMNSREFAPRAAAGTLLHELRPCGCLNPEVQINKVNRLLRT